MGLQSKAPVCANAPRSGDVTLNFDLQIVAAKPPQSTLQPSSQMASRVPSNGPRLSRPFSCPLMAHLQVAWPISLFGFQACGYSATSFPWTQLQKWMPITYSNKAQLARVQAFEFAEYELPLVITTDHFQKDPTSTHTLQLWIQLPPKEPTHRISLTAGAKPGPLLASYPVSLSRTHDSSLFGVIASFIEKCSRFGASNFPPCSFSLISCLYGLIGQGLPSGLETTSLDWPCEFENWMWLKHLRIWFETPLLQPSSFMERTFSTTYLLWLLVSKPSKHSSFILHVKYLVPGARRCFSKSMPHDVTRLSSWSLNTMSPLTHLSYATNSMSSSLESLSYSMLFQFKLLCISQRGWIIPSSDCTLHV